MGDLNVTENVVFKYVIMDCIMMRIMIDVKMVFRNENQCMKLQRH